MEHPDDQRAMDIIRRAAKMLDWKTGSPPGRGWYLVTISSPHKPVRVMWWENGWVAENPEEWGCNIVLAWQDLSGPYQPPEG